MLCLDKTFTTWVFENIATGSFFLIIFKIMGCLLNVLHSVYFIVKIHQIVTPELFLTIGMTSFVFVFLFY